MPFPIFPSPASSLMTMTFALLSGFGKSAMVESTAFENPSWLESTGRHDLCPFSILRCGPSVWGSGGSDVIPSGYTPTQID